MKMKNGYVYILKRSNDTYYIGSTKNIKDRINRHKSGRVKSTKNLLPIILVFYQEFDTLLKARRIEYKLKKLKSRKIIEKIIKDNIITMEP